MDDDSYSMNANCIVSSYINYRIQKAGFEWQTSPTSKNCPDNELVCVVRELCDEFEQRYGQKFSDIVKDCGEKVSKDNNSYNKVLSELLVGELNWGRVIALLTFSGAMAVYCMSRDRPHEVDLIRDWTSCFLQNKVEQWIKENNGWKGLVEFKKNGQSKKENWGSKLVVGALGAIALGALVISRG